MPTQHCAFYVYSHSAPSLELFRQLKSTLTAVDSHFWRKLPGARAIELTTWASIPSGDLVEGIIAKIGEAAFVVADLSPYALGKSGDGSGPEVFAFNGNVFFELAIALTLQIPTFAFCRTDYIAHLPSNYRKYVVHALDLQHPEDLAREFRHWLDVQQDNIVHHVRLTEGRRELTYAYVRAHRTQPQIGEDEYSRHFSGLVNNFADDLSRVGKFYRHLHVPPPGTRRWSLLEEVFMAGIAGLGTNDGYYTMSTIEFWASFEQSGRGFLVAHKGPLQRGAEIKRIFMVRRWPLLRAEELDILACHDRLAREHNNYEVRVLARPTTSVNDDDHLGIVYRYGDSEYTAFKPLYAGTRLAGLKKIDQADLYYQGFKEQWPRAGPLSALLGALSRS